MARHERLIHVKNASKSASVIISNLNGNSRLKEDESFFDAFVKTVLQMNVQRMSEISLQPLEGWHA
jgi:hypothetical protein